MREYGKKSWIFADGFCPSVSTCGISHDCVCLINTCTEPAHVRLTALFEEDLPPMVFETVCPPARCRHFRMDKAKDASGKELPRDTCYALVIESDQKIVAQYSRLDTSLGNEALCTTIGYGE